MATFHPFPSTSLISPNYSGVLSLSNKDGRKIEALLRDPGARETGHYITLYTSLPSLFLEAFWDREWTVQVWVNKDTDKEQIIYQVPHPALWEESWEGPFWDKEISDQLIQALPAQEVTDAQRLARAVSDLLICPPSPMTFSPEQLIHVDSQLAPSWHYLQDDKHITVFKPLIAQGSNYTYLSLWLPNAMVESFSLYRDESGDFFIAAHNRLTNESIFKPLENIISEEFITDIFGNRLNLKLLATHLQVIFAR